MEPERERREYLRADLNVFINATGPGGVQLARATDISERGVHFIRPVCEQGKGHQRLLVEFSLPEDERPMRFICRVVHENEMSGVLGTAVEFTALHSSDAVRIRQYVIRRNRAELFDMLRKEHLGPEV